MAFSDRFTAARKAAGFTQRSLAKELGIKFQSVQKWESGETQPRGKRLEKIAALLNVTIADLIPGDAFAFRTGRNIFNLRKEKMLSIVQLSKLSDIDLLRFSEIENGECRSTVEELNQISLALDIDMDAILGYPSNTDNGPQNSDAEAKEPSAEYTHQPMPWPESPEQISVAFIDDVANRVSNVVDADVSDIRKVILEAIVEHYKQH